MKKTTFSITSELFVSELKIFAALDKYKLGTKMTTFNRIITVTDRIEIEITVQSKTPSYQIA